MGPWSDSPNPAPAPYGSEGMIAATLPALVSAATSIGNTMLQNKYNKEQAERANQMNRENQQWLLEQNKQLQKEQREYDSPAAQMARYIAAGLNPHLIYGNGTSAGSAFPISAGNLPPAQVGQRLAGIPDISRLFLAAQSSIAQTQLANARTSQVEQNTALQSVQTDIAKTNPMLQPWVAEWVSTSMAETARLKSLESRAWMTDVYGTDVMKVSARVNAELEAMTQKLGLNTADLAIKNKILESKEFENAVKEIQAKWLKDSEVTPEHIRQALMLLLSKMVGK